MGLPIDDTDFFISRVHRISGQLSDPDGDKVDAMAAWADIADYWRTMVAARRKAAARPGRRPDHATSPTPA